MRRFYINSNGRLKRHENTIYLEYEKDGETLKKAIPINDIDCIHIFGEIDVNSKLLNFLSQNDVPLYFYNYYGYYSGTYLPRKKNVSGMLLIEQVKFHLNPENRLYLASCFIESAAFHITRNLRKYSIDDSQIKEIEEKFLPGISQSKEIEQLMGYEGNIRQRYYKLFNSIIKNPDFHFERREKRPPDNPINALISFGNSMMYSTVLSEIYKTQLDPTIGYLHAPREKRFSLSLDISEIFKPLIVDPLIFSLINQGTITKDDFERELNFAYLNEEGRKKFLKAYEEKLETTVKHRKLKRNVSYKTLIILECYKLIKHLISDEVYKPFKAWW